MSQPPRLLDSGTAFERELLGSARSDAGGDDGFKRALAAMGAGVATTAASTAAAGTASVGTAATGGGASTVLGGSGAVIVVKWVGVAAALVGLGSATASVTSYVRSQVAIDAAGPARAPEPIASRNAIASRDLVARATQPAVSLVVAPPAALAPSVLVAPTAPVPADVASLGLRDSQADPPRSPPLTMPGARKPVAALQPTAPIAAWTAPPRTSSTGAALSSASASAAAPPLAPATSAQAEPPRPSSLDAEIAALDRVRSSLASHDPNGALRELDAYERAFPTSMLADEALVLRIDALVAKGDRGAAETLGRRFLAAHPGSPHAAQLLRLLDHSHNP